MRDRIWVFLCVVVVGLTNLWVIEPRLHHEFPSMVDDWSAIANAPDQLREVLLLGNPESQRYRPGFVLWNALQWHTLGAPETFVGPQFWNLLRVALLVFGVTALAALLVRSGSSHAGAFDARWLLVVAVPLTVVSAPALPIDFVRFGPQEPLMVGCMALGAALLTSVIDRLLDGRPTGIVLPMLTLAGLILWAFGVLQKETSTCVLVIAPFLLPTIRRQRERWSRLTSRRRAVLCGVGAGICLPFVPMLIRTLQLSTADKRVYEEFAEEGFVARIWEQFADADELVHSPVFAIVAVAAVVAAIGQLLGRRPDWLVLGLMATALAFVLFAAESGVVATRYYLPPLTLLCIAIARSVTSVGRAATFGVGIVAIALSAVQLPDARGWVEWWVDTERSKETLVRQAAAMQAGGCDLDVTGHDVELVQALPVLMPLANEPARDCVPGARYVVVVDAYSGRETGPDDPLIARCQPEADPVWSSDLATIRRCTA
jgi:hypothetical protein